MHPLKNAASEKTNHNLHNTHTTSSAHTNAHKHTDTHNTQHTQRTHSTLADISTLRRGAATRQGHRTRWTSWPSGTGWGPGNQCQRWQQGMATNMHKYVQIYTNSSQTWGGSCEEQVFFLRTLGGPAWLALLPQRGPSGRPPPCSARNAWAWRYCAAGSFSAAQYSARERGGRGKTAAVPRRRLLDPPATVPCPVPVTLPSLGQ